MSDYRIETATGGQIDYKNPAAIQIKVEDIARGLTFQPRFMGQTEFFYSVAQHSLLVSRIVGDLGGTAGQGYYGLLHDAHEAYIGDLPTPLKKFLGAEYRVIRMRLDRAITDHFELQPNAFHHPLVKQADAIALRAEAEVLKVSRGSSIRWHRPPYPCDGWANYTASVEMASTFVEVEQEFLAAAGTFSGVLA